VLNEAGWCSELVRVPVNAATANDLFHILRYLLYFQSLTCMWIDQSKGQLLQEILSLLFLMFSKVRHIFCEKKTNAFKAALSIIP